MKNKSKMTTVAVMALLQSTNAVKLGAKLDSELIVDAESALDAELELDEAADLTQTIDPENQFFEYIEGVSQDALKLEKAATFQASHAHQSLTQAKSKDQYLKSKQKLEDAQDKLFKAEETL